jgi:hypothetical protein
MTLYNEINAAVIERSVTIPPGCEFRDETSANLDEQAPLSQWSRGFSLALLLSRRMAVGSCEESRVATETAPSQGQRLQIGGIGTAS